jgi:hypothetical protein
MEAFTRVQGEGGAAAARPRRSRHGAAGVPLLQGAPRPGRLRKGHSPGWRASVGGLRPVCALPPPRIKLAVKDAARDRAK